MEINEGEVRITNIPDVTIGDKSLATLVHERKTSIIAKTILELCNKIRQQREEIERLSKNA